MTTQTANKVSYLGCENCGDSEAFVSDDDGLFFPDESVVCPTCGATSTVDVDPETEMVYATLQYCRHNRSFEENCIRCEVEGIDTP